MHAMFGRKPPSNTPESPRPTGLAATPLQPTAARPMAATASRSLGSGDAETTANVVRPAPAQPVRRPAEPIRSEAAAPREVRKLIVGRGIAFSGEISACDDLIVEGTVEARLPGGHRIEITESGLFRGTVEIDEADIGGRFEGEITVKDRLTVRATGRIDGKVQYGELAVEAGGVLQGDVRSIAEKAPKVAPKAGIRPPAPVETAVPLSESSGSPDLAAESAAPDIAQV
jgi:cytoskeletal protein CcmA (bactofilin family)